MTRSHRTTRPRRRGVTLLEVLIAILILGVGLISLATLFPIGMARLANAARNSRSALLRPIADDIEQVRDDVLASTNDALADFLQGDTSQSEAHCKQFAIHDAQLTALIQKFQQVQPNLQDEKDRLLAERAIRELKRWRQTVREVKESFRILAEWEQQKSNPPPGTDL
jgi:prepilin-type N-terminal cleavage/methylation domain-containing protein